MDLEAKQKQLEQVLKWGAGAAIVIAAGTVAMLALTSIAAIAAAAVTGLVAVNVVPVIARRLASWRVAQLRADAMRNPIPALVRQYELEAGRAREARLRVVRFGGAARTFKTKLAAFEQRGADPESLEEMRRVYADMLRALAAQTDALVAQFDALADFRAQIDDAQERWEMAQTMREATDQTNQFTDQDPLERVLRQDALQAVTARLNEGFAALEVSMRLDYRALPANLANQDTVSIEQLSGRLQQLEAK